MARPRYRVDPKLKEYGTPTQIKYLEAVNEHRSFAAAARALHKGVSVIRDAIYALEEKAALCGYSPEHDMVHTVPPPFVVKGVSTYYDKDGEVRGQWVKSQLDREQMEAAVKAAISALAEELPRIPQSEPPTDFADHLCNLYTLTDCHVGMRSWKHETGENWDLEIAERVLISAFSHLVRASPKAKYGFVNQLGDFLHFDGLSPVTPTAGHVLDGDGRIGKVVRVAVKILRAIISEALLYNEIVYVLMAEGNHDPAGSVWLRHLFALLYEHEPRVKVIDSEMPYYAFQHGNVMLAFHHGHLKKNDALPLLFASQFPLIWGATKKRYCHSGHRHHLEEKEHNGMKVTQHPTLAARDAYASRGGWVAERQITGLTYHKEFGQVASATIVPEMLETA